MSAVPLIGFILIALLAIGFAVVPLLRMKEKKGRALLLAAIALFMLGIGGGTYFFLGRPHLAQRAAQGLGTREVNGLIPMLIARVRQRPNDAEAWRYLAQAYVAARDARDAAKAMAKVIALTGKGDGGLDSAYGMALAQDAGAVTPQAEAAFADALAVDPHDAAARFYLGLARQERGDRAGAAALWNSLLADTPAAAPLHQMLVDRLAMLTAQAGPGAAPNPQAMVAMLAARLKADPNDALGWVRLMRAYAVLGETAKAKEALATARKTFKDNADAQTAFATAAKALKLE